jgi:flagellar basal body rod protein FlgG
MEKFSITITAENGHAKVDFALNGQPIKGLFAVNLLADTRSGEFHLTGRRFKLNDNGNFYVDPETKDTAMENFNLLSLLEEGAPAEEQIRQISKELDYSLQNIKDTSTLRARNLIAERLN